MVRNPVYFCIGVVLTLPLGYFLIDRIDFAWSSRTVMASVASISTHSTVCFSKSQSHCTASEAHLSYRVGNTPYQVAVPADSGYNLSTRGLRFHVNQVVPVAYDARDPSRAHLDTFGDVWGAPLLTFIAQLSMLVGSVHRGRGPRWR